MSPIQCLKLWTKKNIRHMKNKCRPQHSRLVYIYATSMKTLPYTHLINSLYTVRYSTTVTLLLLMLHVSVKSGTRGDWWRVDGGRQTLTSGPPAAQTYWSGSGWKDRSVVVRVFVSIFFGTTLLRFASKCCVLQLRWKPRLTILFSFVGRSESKGREVIKERHLTFLFRFFTSY